MLWAPNEGPQLDMIMSTWCRVLFYGGARGGGKTSGLLGDYLQDVSEYGEHWQGIFVRKSYPELEEVIRQGKEMFFPTGATYLKGERLFLWPNGASLKMRHIDRIEDTDKYQGHQYPWIGYDELTNQAHKEAFTRMFACNRWTSRYLPTRRIRASGNPGGAGHAWAKSMFIDRYPAGYQPFVPPDEDLNEFEMMYLPARVRDNPRLLLTNPGYLAALKMCGSPELVRAWLDGDWNVIFGAYFPEFTHQHVIEPVDIPSWWMRFRCMDWGTYHPFACLWVAVSDGTIPGIPKDALVVYRELYGSDGDDKGINWTVEEVAEEVRRLSEGEDIAYTVCDPSMPPKQSVILQGPSLAEVFEDNGILLQAGDNARIAGWQQIRIRLKTHLVKVFSTCHNLVRTFPLQQHSRLQPEDLDTTGPDHLLDALRYGCMSRPWSLTAPQQDPIKVLTVGSGHLPAYIAGREVERLTLDELFMLEEHINRVREHMR